MAQIVRIVVAVTVNEGQIAAFEEIAKAMVHGSKQEPGTLGYDWHFTADRRHWHVVETYAGPEAVVAHFTGPVVGQLVPKILEVSQIDRVEVYGDPGPEATAMLTSFGALFFSHWEV